MLAQEKEWAGHKLWKVTPQRLCKHWDSKTWPKLHKALIKDCPTTGLNHGVGKMNNVM